MPSSAAKAIGVREPRVCLRQALAATLACDRAQAIQTVRVAYPFALFQSSALRAPVTVNDLGGTGGEIVAKPAPEAMLRIAARIGVRQAFTTALDGNFLQAQ
ncbi:hypothetical protein [Ralstonia pseudosolanacearum]|uniref:hypothetical protein n=1 Tax=Ralstonia pseudosolanacearum TaxID=1310165 RepID=UPI003CEAF964